MTQGSDRQVMMRDQGYGILKYEIETLMDYGKYNPYMEVDSIFKQETIIDLYVYNVKEGSLLLLLSSLGNLYCYLVIPQSGQKGNISLVVNLVARSKLDIPSGEELIEARINMTEPDTVQIW